MKIVLKKRLQAPSIITIIRADGSRTWNKIHRGLETHDIAHYAVEKELGFKQAFYGIIEAGSTIQDFDAPRAQRSEVVLPNNLSPEAIQTEHIVNLLETEWYQKSDPMTLLPMLKEILDAQQLPFPTALTTTALANIRITYHKLAQQWQELKAEEELELELQL